jgi:hypothetical protein
MNHTASRKLGWKTPFEAHYGDTPDISVFRFEFWEPVYYHDPHLKFPHPNLLPGRFLGIARTTGDTFTFYVYTQRPKGRNTVLARSVIRRRFPGESEPQADYTNEGDSALDMTTGDSNINNMTLGTDDSHARTPEQREEGLHDQLQLEVRQAVFEPTHVIQRRDIVIDIL